MGIQPRGHLGHYRRLRAQAIADRQRVGLVQQQTGQPARLRPLLRLPPQRAQVGQAGQRIAPGLFVQPPRHVLAVAVGQQVIHHRHQHDAHFQCQVQQVEEPHRRATEHRRAPQVTHHQQQRRRQQRHGEHQPHMQHAPGQHRQHGDTVVGKHRAPGGRATQVDAHHAAESHAQHASQNQQEQHPPMAVAPGQRRPATLGPRHDQRQGDDQHAEILGKQGFDQATDLTWRAERRAIQPPQRRQPQRQCQQAEQHEADQISGGEWLTLRYGRAPEPGPRAPVHPCATGYRDQRAHEQLQGRVAEVHRAQQPAQQDDGIATRHHPAVAVEDGDGQQQAGVQMHQRGLRRMAPQFEQIGHGYLLQQQAQAAQQQDLSAPGRDPTVHAHSPCTSAGVGLRRRGHAGTKRPLGFVSPETEETNRSALPASAPPLASKTAAGRGCAQACPWHRSCRLSPWRTATGHRRLRP